VGMIAEGGSLPAYSEGLGVVVSTIQEGAVVASKGHHV
jgi:hypothetical protein